MAAVTPAFDPRKIALDIRRAIMTALRESESMVRNRAIGNLDRVLRRKSGQLASSIYSETKSRRGGGRLTIGTPVYYGRFWELGHFRGSKFTRRERRQMVRSAIGRGILIRGGAKFYKRPWLRPAADEAMPEVQRRVEMHLDRAMKQYSGTVTIDMKIT